MKGNVMIYYMDMNEASFKKAVSTEDIEKAHEWFRTKEHGNIHIYQATATKRNIDAMSGALEFMNVLSLHHHVVYENVGLLETKYSKRDRV